MMMTKLMVVLFSSVVVIGETNKVQLLKPVATDVWSQGASVWVMWDLKSVGDEGPDKIDLDLYVGPGEGALMENISFGVPIGELAAEWVVKRNLPPGNDFFVKVTSPDVKGFKAVSDRFTITKNNTKGQGNSAGSLKSSGNSQLTLFVTLLVVLLGVNCCY